jgi:hypothetical protein
VGEGELQKKERKFARKLIILALSASIKVVNFLQKKVKKKTFNAKKLKSLKFSPERHETHVLLQLTRAKFSRQFFWLNFLADFFDKFSVKFLFQIFYPYFCTLYLKPLTLSTR